MDRKRFPGLSGIAAWARPEPEYILDRVGWPLREQEWGPYQPSVERLLRLVDDLHVALDTLQAEMTPQADFAWSS